MSNDRLKYLLERYAADASTPEETTELFEWIKNLKDDVLFKEKVKELWTDHNLTEPLPQTDWNTIYTKITNVPVIGRRRIWPRIWAAAAIIASLSAGSYFMLNQQTNEQPIAVTEKPGSEYKLLPGTDRAVLTLANGNQIILVSSGNGALT